MSNKNDTIIITDADGKSWLVKDGEYLRDERGDRIPPMHSRRISAPGEFAIYDSSQGHCSLCGSLTCNGSCFK